jgi:hypothetical protein
MQSFILPSNGQATPDSIARKRRLAEAMLASGMETGPIGHWSQGAARMVQALTGGLAARKADEQDAALQAETKKEAMARQLLEDQRYNDQLQYGRSRDTIGDTRYADEQAYTRGRDAKADAMPKYDIQGGQVITLDPRAPLDTAQAAPIPGYAAPAPEDYTLGENQTRFSGDNKQIAQGVPKTPDTQISLGGEVPDGELRKELQKNEAKNWGELQNVANVSAQTAQDLTIVDELVEMAPTGPVTGRLAEMFPGVSSSSAALDSIVKRLAPTLRVPGSGATSDIEYEGMLRGYPALRNYPEANRLISQIMKAKAAINVERGAIIDAYSSNKIDAPTARAQLNEINKRSILSPEMRRLLAGVDPDQSNATDLDQRLQRYK